MLNKILRRLTSRGRVDYPILVNSIPKSGTNLLKNIVLSIPGTLGSGVDLSLANETTTGEECLAYLQEKIGKPIPGSVYVGHVPYSEKVERWLRDNNVKQLFIYRDPRDVCVSLYHYIMKNKEKKHAYYNMYNSFGSNDLRLMRAIVGYGNGEKEFNCSADSIPSINHLYEAYVPWVQHNESEILSVRYEDLVSEVLLQDKIIENIIFFVNPYIKNTGHLREVKKKGMDPTKSHTFRKGCKGEWKNEFESAHIEAFKKVFDQKMLSDLGYELM